MSSSRLRTTSSSPDSVEERTEHKNTIIHIDIDYFYAQVEELRDPQLKDKPLGIQQKQCLVTCNYKAREFGIKKLMSVTEAQKLCPDLVLVNGEDLTPYRQMSGRIFEVISRKYPNANKERLGMDENFVDVTHLVAEKMDVDETMELQGCFWPPADGPFSTDCACGCEKRLIVASRIAEELRQTLFKELGITTSAGIGHNKLLAKLAGGIHKPNNQTVVIPNSCKEFMLHLKELKLIPGIGQKTESLLREVKVNTIEDLQKVDMKVLVLKFGPEMAKKLKDWGLGQDFTPVKASNVKPKSIGLEDSCKPISLRQDIENKFETLLTRLLNQMVEDGRIPLAIKMTLRKFDAVRKTSHRETKQANILPTMFKLDQDCRPMIVEGGQEKLLKIVMRLFDRIVDMRNAFNITLLGLAFSKFHDKPRLGGSSIANFLIKKQDIEVQSITNLSSEGVALSDPKHTPLTPFNGRSFYQDRDHEAMSDTMSIASDVSEPSEIVEPSPKKSRLNLNLIQAKRRCQAAAADPMDCSSPSKLRVADLRLNSIERDRENMATTPTSPKLVIPCVDPDVFKELPPDVQNELIASWTSSTATASSTTTTTANKNKQAPQNNTLHRYFIANK